MEYHIKYGYWNIKQRRQAQVPRALRRGRGPRRPTRATPRRPLPPHRRAPRRPRPAGPAPLRARVRRLPPHAPPPGALRSWRPALPPRRGRRGDVLCRAWRGPVRYLPELAPLHSLDPSEFLPLFPSDFHVLTLSLSLPPSLPHLLTHSLPPPPLCLSL
jgi:hypothetical protein